MKDDEYRVFGNAVLTKSFICKDMTVCRCENNDEAKRCAFHMNFLSEIIRDDNEVFENIKKILLDEDLCAEAMVSEIGNVLNEEE